MILLDVPYDKRNEAKNLGAKWSPDYKKWYVEKREDYGKFIKWMGDDKLLVLDNLYLIEGIHTCFKCGKDTRVIGFGLDKYLPIYDYIIDDSVGSYDLERFARDIKLSETMDPDIHIVGPIDPIPEALMRVLSKKYNYKMRYSKTINRSSISNCCDYCDVLQGDFFLFSEVDSPFWINDIEDVKKLKIYHFILNRDLLVEANEGWSSFDELFKKYGRIKSMRVKI